METNLLIALMSCSRSRSNSHCVGSAVKSSGAEGELRRMGLSLPKTNGLMSRPMTFPGKDARLGLITPMAICKPEVQCASTRSTGNLPHRRSLSGRKRMMRRFTSSTRVPVKEIFHGTWPFCSQCFLLTVYLSVHQRISSKTGLSETSWARRRSSRTPALLSGSSAREQDHRNLRSQLQVNQHHQPPIQLEKHHGFPPWYDVVEKRNVSQP